LLAINDYNGGLLLLLSRFVKALCEIGQAVATLGKAPVLVHHAD